VDREDQDFGFGQALADLPGGSSAIWFGLTRHTDCVLAISRFGYDFPIGMGLENFSET